MVPTADNQEFHVFPGFHQLISTVAYFDLVWHEDLSMMEYLAKKKSWHIFLTVIPAYCLNFWDSCHKMEGFCPLCIENGRNSKVTFFQVNFEEAVLLCSCTKCPFPFVSDFKSVVLKNHYMSRIEDHKIQLKLAQLIRNGPDDDDVIWLAGRSENTIPLDEHQELESLLSNSQNETYISDSELESIMLNLEGSSSQAIHDQVSTNTQNDTGDTFAPFIFNCNNEPLPAQKIKKCQVKGRKRKTR